MESVCEMTKESSHNASCEDSVEDADNSNNWSNSEASSYNDPTELNETCDSDEKPDSVVKYNNHTINVHKIIKQAYADWVVPYKVLDKINDIEIQLIWNHDKMFEKLNKNKSTTVKIKRAFQKEEVELVFKRWRNFCKLFCFDNKKPNYFYHTPVSSKLFPKCFIIYFTSYITQDLSVSLDESVVLWNFQCLFEDSHKIVRYSDYDDTVIKVLHDRLDGNTVFTNYILAHCLNKSYKSVVKRHCKLRSKLDNDKSNSKKCFPKIELRKQALGETKSLKQTQSFVHKTNPKSGKYNKISKAQSSESGCGSMSETDYIAIHKELESVLNAQPMNSEFLTSNKDKGGESESSSSDSGFNNNLATVQLDPVDVEMDQEANTINRIECLRNVDVSPGEQDRLLKRTLVNLKKLEESSKIVGCLIDSILKVKQLARSNIDKLSTEPISVQEWFEIADLCKRLAAHQAKAVFDSHVYPVLFTPVDQNQLIYDIIQHLRKEELVQWEDVKWSEVSRNMSSIKPLFLFHAFANFVNRHVPQQLHQNLKDCLDFILKEKLPSITDKNIDGFILKL